MNENINFPIIIDSGGGGGGGGAYPEYFFFYSHGIKSTTKHHDQTINRWTADEKNK